MLHKNIIDLNVHFLILARDMAREDPLHAKVTLNLDDKDLDTLLNESLEGLMQIAAAPTPLLSLARPLRPITGDAIDDFALAMTFFRKP